MKKVVIKKPLKVLDGEREVVLSSFQKNFVDDSLDANLKHGTLTKEQLRKGGRFKVGKEEFFVFPEQFVDSYKGLERGAQIITLKDLGHVVAFTGLNRDSVVVDAGVGSGAFTCFAAKIAEKVFGFDVEEKNVELAKRNVERLGLDNVVIEKKDVYNPEGIRVKDIDVFMLDVPEPERALETADKVLKVGGFLVVYTPHVDQARKVVVSLPENFLFEKTVEVTEREWIVDSQRLRPKSKDLGHTAFLTFVRKIE